MKKQIKMIALAITGLVVGVMVARKEKTYRRVIGNSLINVSDSKFSTQIK